MQDLQFLSNTALDFLTLPSDANVYRYIGEKLKEIASESVISVNSYDPTSGSLVARALVGLGKYDNIIQPIGAEPISVSFKVGDEEARSNLLTGKLIKSPDGAHEPIFGKIPRRISHEVKKLLGSGDIYGIGFSWGGRLYGSAMISSRSTNSLLKKKHTIETFIHQASLALQRKEAEDALRESEERYRSIFENSLDGIVLFHSDDRILAANPEACRMHGYSEAEILRLDRDDIVDTTDPRLRDSIEERVRTGRFRGEVTHRRKDGSKFPCEVTTAVFKEKHGPESRVAIIRDVTERKRGEAERERMAARVADGERRYRSLFESMSEGFVLFRVLRDETGHPIDFVYLEMNPAWERLTRISRNSAAGKLVSEVLPEAVPWDVVLAKHALGSRKAYRIERYSRWAAKWLEYCAYSPGQNLMAVLFTDISERKRAEETLRNARDELEMRVQKRTAELEMKNRELQDFAFIASHDLKEPLRKIQAFGDLLITKSGDSLAHESVDYLIRMQDAAARMGYLLESLLSYSRVTSKVESFSKVNLAEAARNALSNLEIRLKETGGRVEIGDLPTLEGDPVQLVQLFQNLFSNSLKFRREAEEPLVRVHSRLLEDGMNDAAEVEIYVEDNGMGFDEKYLDKIFVPFQRLHGREEYEGVGMGLAICRKITERHGGTINAKSTPGKGSIFIMRLPTSRDTG